MQYFAKAVNPFSCRLRELKKREFGDFLKLIKEREPEFKELLTVANGVVNDIFFNPAPCAAMAVSYSQPLPTSAVSGRNSSGGVASVSSADDEFREAASGGRLAFTPPVSLDGGNPTEAADTFSGPDLDALLTYSFQQAAGYPQPNSIFNHCYLWRSIRFDDPEGVNELPSWFPHLQRSCRPLRRYQILPFYYTKRWQLAVFDINENLAVCYDTTWTSGSPNSTFVVSQVLCACLRLGINIYFKSLQRCFDATVGVAQREAFNYHHKKVGLYDA